jgi:hypothetical protein
MTIDIQVRSRGFCLRARSPLPIYGYCYVADFKADGPSANSRHLYIRILKHVIVLENTTG